MNIGKLERIDDLRTIWKHEAHDFSVWLAEEENLALLGETVGLDISLIKLEEKVGGFSADIYAEEENTGKKIIIENQLEDSNHDHLGKIITYASGTDASYVIWIVKRARDEHRRAIEWLNEHTMEDVNFFLLEIELWKIGNSEPAPKFNVVERPNNWAKEEKKSASQITESNQRSLDFWTAFNDYAAQNKVFTQAFSLRKPSPQHWYDLSVGYSNMHISMNLQFKKNTVDIGIYIPDDKEQYQKFYEHKDAVEEKIGTQAIWHTATKASRFFVKHDASLDKEENWNAIFDWLMDMAYKVKATIALTK